MNLAPYSLLAVLLSSASLLIAGEWPSELSAPQGSSPKLDGIIGKDEWADATSFEGTKGWTPQFTPTTSPADLSLRGWVKYDDSRLWFAFDVTDDVLYGIDTDRWLPEKNPQAHELTPLGWPWFGDEMEILINAANTWEGDENASGSGHSWQMVCNLTKSRLGGIGTGGLLEGEPRVKPEAWSTYRKWIESGAMQAVAKPKTDGKGYIIEWSIAFDPCLELKPGTFFAPSDQEVVMGLNIAIGDLDEKAKGQGNFGNFLHEDWLAGEKNQRTNLRQFGRLRMMPKK
jgi:SSS family solute:Na+ symporter